MTSGKDFEGDVILVYLVNPPEDFMGGIPIINPVIEEKGGVKFVVGKMPSDPRDWSSDMPVGVSLTQIAHYLVFASIEDYYKKSEFSTFGESPLQ